MKTTESRAERAEAVLRDTRWNSLVGRDRLADGKFFYSVASTGVYCRPSCGARTPRPENVAFHATIEEAEAQMQLTVTTVWPGQLWAAVRRDCLRDRVHRLVRKRDLR
ncbi:Ada metal-binding domain-containing protein [Terriglobus roseus]|uniref:AraC family transcriptional regulator, regulatory protein of adaptative response / methylated-DNA-[protein]-cysteine methyltransferase n=1 Tax=Terriglobus roseus TaxID=392734 RepID=A0A1H4K2X2_9BACT|nr:Ada metal-binding domain-containing protein [Terriglobus roseus]SEB52880.1 AraC family transcriptional regulator, regulatory protein of adaptative response / methylated-DNA-[protein]-cysteine methyltransferase [Terriglobus roseus]